MGKLAAKIIDGNEVYVIVQVVAEAIYVLVKLYEYPKKSVVDLLLHFCVKNNVYLESEEILIYAIEEYGNSGLDFVDVLLYSHQKYYGIETITFDRKLQAKLKGLEIIE